MKLRSTKGLQNTKRIFPNVGETTIDANGECEVLDEEISQKLIETGDWEDAEPEEVEEEEDVEEETTEDEEEEETEEDVDVKASLAKMKLPELQALAKESKIAGWEKLKNNEKGLRALLKSKL